MQRWLGAALVLVANLVAVGALHAENYRPGFACPRPDESDQLTTAICNNSAMAQAELILEKAYQLHREVDGPSASQALKARAATIEKTTREVCRIPAPGKPGPMPPESPVCYIIQTKKLADEWARSLYLQAFDERYRDIDTHIAAQRKLAADGLMPSAEVDGVYSEVVREAIIAWQRSKNVATTGFLSDLQTRQLLMSPPPLNVPSVQETADKLQALFTNDMLNIRVPYLETMTGPAMRVARLAGNREARTYRIVGFNVTAYVLAGDVYGYGLDVNRACKPDISEFVRSIPRTTWPSTFGTFGKDLNDATFQATCLSSCGNGAPSIVVMRYQGAHADNYINLELTVPLVNDRVLEASYIWSEAMRPRGEDYIINGRFNCESRYQSVAQKTFADVAFTHLFVGTGQDEIADQIDPFCRKR